MKIFFDTSAFAKRYIAEAGSNQVLALSGQAGSLLVSVICLPELILSLSRLVREKNCRSVTMRRSNKPQRTIWPTPISSSLHPKC